MPKVTQPGTQASLSLAWVSAGTPSHACICYKTLRRCLPPAAPSSSCCRTNHDVSSVSRWLQPPQVLPTTATWTTAPQLMSEPSLPPGLAPSLLSPQPGHESMLSSPCPRCHPGPWALRTHCPTPSERPGQLGAAQSLSHPRCWVSATPFRHDSLVSAQKPAAPRPQGAGLCPLPRHPLCDAPLLGAAMPPGTPRHHTSNQHPVRALCAPALSNRHS